MARKALARGGTRYPVLPPSYCPGHIRSVRFFCTPLLLHFFPPSPLRGESRTMVGRGIWLGASDPVLPIRNRGRTGLGPGGWSYLGLVSCVTDLCHSKHMPRGVRLGPGGGWSYLRGISGPTSTSFKGLGTRRAYLGRRVDSQCKVSVPSHFALALNEEGLTATVRYGLIVVEPPWLVSQIAFIGVRYAFSPSFSRSGCRGCPICC